MGDARLDEKLTTVSGMELYWIDEEEKKKKNMLGRVRDKGGVQGEMGYD